MNELIKRLCDCLPDNGHHPDDETWRYCWQELSSDAQDDVKDVRRAAEQFMLDEILREANQ